MAGFCTKCGAPLNDGMAFCTKCGAPAAATDAAPASAPYVPPASNAPAAYTPPAAAYTPPAAAYTPPPAYAAPGTVPPWNPVRWQYGQISQESSIWCPLEQNLAISIS